MKTKIFDHTDKKEKLLMEGKAGLWIDGTVYWFHDFCEKLIPEKRLSVHIRKDVPHTKVKLLEIFVKNHDSEKKHCKLLFMNYIPEEHFCFISPVENVIFHFVEDHVYLVNGYGRGNGMCGATVQPYWNWAADLIWSSLTKGILQYQPLAQGVVASIFSIDMPIPPRKSVRGFSWTVQGKDKEETMALEEMFLKNVLAISHKR